jgi:hypothetical protein
MPRGVRTARSYAHLLYNNGFADAEELASLVWAWRSLYETYQPDVILFDHSPTAIVAARCSRAKRILLGTSFCSPPTTTPLPIFGTATQHEAQQLLQQERLVARAVNQVLACLHSPPIRELSDLYRDIDDNLLLTFEELDHFGARTGGVYCGALNSFSGGRAPQWPPGEGPRVFAYLKPMAGLDQLLATLVAVGCRTIAHGTWASGFQWEEERLANVRLESFPVNLNAVAHDCDLAILNATHGTTAAVLLAGKPILQLPISVEQFLTARNTRRMGAGLMVPWTRVTETQSVLKTMLDSESFAAAARRFAARYASFDPQEATSVLVERIVSFV